VRIDGERRFDAPPEQVFALLTDPAFLVSALPGIERWDLRDRDRWTAVMRPPVPLSPRLKLDFTVLDRREPEHALVRVNGGAFGSGAVVESDFDLAPDDGGTRMRWRAGIELSGMLAALGRSSLEPVAKRQAERMLDALARSVEARAR